MKPAFPSFRLAAMVPAFVLLSLLSGLGVVSLRAAAIDFRRQIEPIFVKRCSECHGPDTQKSELRLDQRAAALKGGKSGKPAIVPGDSKASELLNRVGTTDADERMPPKGEPLTEQQITDLRDWIDQGALWPEAAPSAHWAFVPPERPVPPAPRKAAWVRNEIDRFILDRLERDQLEPQPEADRYTLIRRASLDLIGLPPTWAEVEAFLKDTAPDAYEKLIDRLLASPHYGEHIGRWWLDLARYADSNGYQVDLTRSMWPYRQWVINAFNHNLPFDEFTVAQLAGDLLPKPTRDQKIATGFNRNSKINDEGGGDAEEYRTKAVKDRVATVATTWLGLTMMCSECHSHKYDPLTHEDYYRFYAIFNNTTDSGSHNVTPTLEVPAPDRSKLTGYLRTRIDDVKNDLAEIERGLPAEQADWERRLRGHTHIWQVLTITNAVSTGGATYTNLPDGSILATGVNPIYDTLLLEAGTQKSGVKAILLEVLPDPSLPKNGPGRWDKTGNFILDELTAWAIPSSRAEAAANTNLAFARATADWEQQYYRAEHAVDGNPRTGWAIGPKFGQRHFLVAELKAPTPAAPSTKLGFRFEHYHGNSHTVGRIRLSVTTEADPARWWPVPPDVASVLAIPARRRTPEQQKLITAHYRTVSPRLRELQRELGRLQERLAGLPKNSSTLVIQERDKPRESYIHVRGSFLDRGKVVTPGIPAVFAAGPNTNVSDRLSVARWLVDPQNPLTARVTVNRLWERCFGTGLVKTSEDFGRQGELPSHPELLDWLAREFISPTVPHYDVRVVSTGNGPGAKAKTGPWDFKHMQKLIVMSATYRQSAVTPPALLQKDPYNRLLGRGPRFRMDGEMLRDQALAVSGLLNTEIGGPSVHPIQVPNLWKEFGFLRPEIGMDEWPVSEGPDLYRRGLYTFWRRVCTYPTFATFDAPTREVCLSRRPRTNTPLQALAALNETTFIEAARVFAQRILSEGGPTAAARIEFGFRTCLGRPPSAEECRRLETYYEQQRRGFRRDPAAARALVQVGPAPQAREADVRELAAWVMVANVLFNLDETVTKE